MRAGRRVPVVVSVAVAVTLVGGVAVAVTNNPASAKACVTPGGALRLSVGGKCANGQTAIRLRAQGPKGAPGARGPKGVPGPPGPKGDTGAAGTAQRINLSVDLPEGPPTVTHALATAGPATLIASCQGTAGTTTSLVLSLTGGTDALTFTASDVSTDNGVVANAVDHGASASLGSGVLPTITTIDSRSDVITLVVGSASGKEITGTLDVELNTAALTPACAVGGTLAVA